MEYVLEEKSLVLHIRGKREDGSYCEKNSEEMRPLFFMLVNPNFSATKKTLLMLSQKNKASPCVKCLMGIGKKF